MTTTITIKSAAVAALASQNACNLSGIVHSLSAYMPAIRGATNGTDEANKHPVCILFATQIAHLTGIPYDIGFSAYNKAYEECERLAAEPDPVV